MREVLPATPRARIARLDLGGGAFEYKAGQAILVGTHGQEARRPYSIASAPEDSRRDGFVELLIGVFGDGGAGPHLALEPGALVDVEGPLGAVSAAPTAIAAARRLTSRSTKPRTRRRDIAGCRAK